MPTWRQRYIAYLESEHWRAKRCLALIAMGYRCQECGVTRKRGLHVHHLTYKRLGKEPLSDLQVLCKKCHLAKHLRTKKPKRPSGRKRIRQS